MTSNIRFVAVNPEVHTKLKVRAAQQGKPMGEVIAELLE